MQWASKSTEFDKITQNKGHYAVQGHSRSSIFVPIERSVEMFSKNAKKSIFALPSFYFSSDKCKNF